MRGFNYKLADRAVVIALILADGLIHGLWVAGKINKLHLGAIISLTAAIFYVISAGIIVKTGHMTAELVVRYIAFVSLCIGLFFSCTAVDFISFGTCMMVVINKHCVAIDATNDDDIE